ncbi:hypothetical protein BDY19DRAFT_902278 [Irpex rosettiformis]|uniref:Uncharacterized protein n=1 Tax=Irpex rosettiformis TaxID=378272 RepID=A0ACB8UPH0_9APHY|nr:hypothetical protein BDY19DRAFT_902278 [Irpex rosettiformis]
MRSPAIVFSLMAVSALSPTFVVGTPVPVHTEVNTTDHHRTNSNSPRGLGFLNEIFARTEPDDAPKTAHAAHTNPKVATIAGYTLGKRQFWERDTSGSLKRRSDQRDHSKEHHSHHPKRPQNDTLLKRLDDSQTTGGNAHTGKSGDVSGGSVDSGDNGGMPTLMNINSNNAGDGGGSTAGCAVGGKGESGGNASSGDSGRATGGRVQGSGGMVNMDSNNAGNAGKSSTGCAEAGYSEGAGDNSQASNAPSPTP